MSLGKEYCSFCTVWIASKWLRFIFQLPEMIGLRLSLGIGCLAQGCQSGEVAELEQFETGATTGRHVVDVVVETELGQCRRRVAATDDGERLGVGHRLRQCACAGCESIVFEHAHRPV